jgi:hypothetical protein
MRKVWTMTTTIPEPRRRELEGKLRRAQPAVFSTVPPPRRVPRVEKLYFFDQHADTFYWIHTADTAALRLHSDKLRAELRAKRAEYDLLMRSEGSEIYVEVGLASSALEVIDSLENRLVELRSLLPAVHANGSAPKHAPSVYVELAEQGLTNVEIAARVDPPVSEAAVRRGLAKVGYKRRV